MPSATDADAKSFDGWGPFAFGMAFEDVLSAESAVVWDADSVRRCRDGMSAGGCTLSSADGSRVPSSAGVALLPRIVFNQEGRVASVRLGNFLTPTGEPGRCERTFGQLLDDLHDSWGAPTANPSDERDALKRSTPKGRAFRLRSGNGGTVGSETFHVQPDGRRIILRSVSIGATDSAPAVCHLGIDYRGPERLQPPPDQRPYPLKNWY